MGVSFTCTNDIKWKVLASHITEDLETKLFSQGKQLPLTPLGYVIESNRMRIEGVKKFKSIVWRGGVGIDKRLGMVIQTSDHFCAHFGFQRSTPYMPHVSLLYGDLTDEEKEAARKKVEEMDSEISGLQFEISELALYRTDTEDKSLESWELVEVCHLGKK
ncbi:Cyclic phosphodiesterase [Triticum urartu]|uniref:Cyclic phosphodiesterase n=1 Tax=Triticum urartu TaxID=4572 RepID=M7ZG67_TRIUA|nr:Cyclic phosphodiesterase [Triticum urartu]